MSTVREAPVRPVQMLRFLGPGLIITASIVGSGELIVTPKLGAEIGFQLLWFIILGCLVKVFVQIELGRFAIANGMTTLEAMDTMPGPRLVVSWLVWAWLVMYVALVFQVAGIMGGAGQVFALAGATISHQWWTVLVAMACAGLLVMGRYRLVERVSMVLVALFTFFTVLAVGTLRWTPYQITAANIREGLSFGLPSDFTTAFAAFGIIGVGASELIYYPYWCLEKGYARFVGDDREEAGWASRARGWIRMMRVDAWVSMVIYTGATVAFYLLGAAVLHGKGLEVENDEMIPTLSQMYRESFGAAGLIIFLVGGFAVLFSTAFVATASNARLFADALAIFKIKRYADAEERMKMIKVGCVLLPAASLSLYLIQSKSVTLVTMGAVAQGVMLPLLGIAALYFRFRRTPKPIAPGAAWTVCLAVAALCMVLVGGYQVVRQLIGD